VVATDGRGRAALLRTRCIRFARNFIEGSDTINLVSLPIVPLATINAVGVATERKELEGRDTNTVALYHSDRHSCLRRPVMAVEETWLTEQYDRDLSHTDRMPTDMCG
jgi:hypothetical protein